MTRSRSTQQRAHGNEEQPVNVSVTVGAAQSIGRSATAVPCTFSVTPQIDSIAASDAARSKVCLVFDCSTSMRGDKIQSAIDAANLIVDNLHVRHRLSLVTFSSTSRLFLHNEAPTASARPELKRHIEAVRSEVGGKTRLTLGIRRAMRTFKATNARSHDDGYAKTMIVLSDGGADKPGEAFKAAHQAADDGVQIFAVGVGKAYRADQLLKLVKPAAGAVLDYAESDGLSAAFQAILDRVESFVATNARIELRLDKGVRPGLAYRTSPETASLGQPQAPKGKLVLNMGHLEPTKRYGFLIDLRTRKRNPGRLATAIFTCDVPSLGIQGYCREFEVCADANAPESAESRSGRARRSAEIADAADALARASRVGEQRDALQRLAAAGAEAKSEAVQARSKALLEKLEAHGQLDIAALNSALVAASHSSDTSADADSSEDRKPGPKLYDVVLMDAGEAPILLVREIRSATGRSLVEIGRLLRVKQPVIGQAVRHREARDLLQRVKAVGANAVIHPAQSQQ